MKVVGDAVRQCWGRDGALESSLWVMESAQLSVGCWWEGSLKLEERNTGLEKTHIEVHWKVSLHLSSDFIWTVFWILNEAIWKWPAKYKIIILNLKKKKKGELYVKDDCGNAKMKQIKSLVQCPPVRRGTALTVSENTVTEQPALTAASWRTAQQALQGIQGGECLAPACSTVRNAFSNRRITLSQNTVSVMFAKSKCAWLVELSVTKCK